MSVAASGADLRWWGLRRGQHAVSRWSNDAGYSGVIARIRHIVRREHGDRNEGIERCPGRLWQIDSVWRRGSGFRQGFLGTWQRLGGHRKCEISMFVFVMMLVDSVPDLLHRLRTDEDRVRSVDSGALHWHCADPEQDQQYPQADQDPYIVANDIKHGSASQQHRGRSFRHFTY